MADPGRGPTRLASPRNEETIVRISKNAWLWSCAFVGVVALAGCSKMYYATWEKLGKEKRDLLRDNVAKVQKEQDAAQEQFKDALTRLREMTGFQGGALEKQYGKLKADYEDSEKRATDVRDRIEKIEGIATDLFSEWDGEIKEVSDASYRTTMRRQLDDTKRKYQSLSSALHQSAASMDPVLRKLKDQVLLLKSSLNAAAVGGIEAHAKSIEGDIDELVKDIQNSIKVGNEFIAQLPAE
jgi:uncharacterized protein YukE